MMVLYVTQLQIYNFKRRMIYAMLSSILFSAGVCLVLYGRHFPHLRGWLGDYLVTICIFFSIKVFFPLRNGIRLSVGVFIFSFLVELVQLSGIAGYLQLSSLFWQLTIGSRFDVFDIVLYAAGCVSAVLIDWVLGKR